MDANEMLHTRVLAPYASITWNGHGNLRRTYREICLGR